jgi:hypothetical protein
MRRRLRAVARHADRAICSTPTDWYCLCYRSVAGYSRYARCCQVPIRGNRVGSRNFHAAFTDWPNANSTGDDVSIRVIVRYNRRSSLVLLLSKADHTWRRVSSFPKMTSVTVLRRPLHKVGPKWNVLDFRWQRPAFGPESEHYFDIVLQIGTVVPVGNSNSNILMV